MSQSLVRAYAALAAICLIWGMTYPAIKIAVSDFPPFLLVGIRQTSAGLILLALAWRLGAGRRRTDRSYIVRQGLTGLMMITGGNGFITWAMLQVSSGLAAVIGSLTPVFVVLINMLWRGGESVTPRMALGVALGFGGMGLIFSEGWADFGRPEYRWGIAGCFASCITWSLGTVMAKRFNDVDVSPVFNAGLQVAAGGMGGFVLGLLLDPVWTIRHSSTGWGAVIFLTLLGSALAFSLYTYVLRRLNATMASLYTYINPIVAVLAGWLWLGEPLGARNSIGMALTISGVWVVNQSGLRRLRSRVRARRAA
ncbi:MAG: DMT family transporter [Saprospiraceae bacterium]